MTDKVLEIYLKLLEIGKLNNFGNTETVLNTYMAGANYYLLGENDSARVYWERALAYPDENPSIEALKYRPIAQMADLYYADGKVDSAKLYKQIAIEWYSENGFLYWATDVSTSLATICFKNNEFVMAEKYFRQSEKLFKEMIDKNSWYRYDSLKYVVSYGTELYLPIPHNKMKEMMWGSGRKMYYGLYQINEANKRIEDALKYFIEYHNATDTLHKIQRSRETMELQTKYESERKDQQIETLSLENELKESRLEQNSYFLFGSVGLIIIILMFGYILIRQDKLKTNHKMILLQQKLFRSQMNPHFIFNSLTSIQGFITEKDPRTASRYLSKFAKLIRNILDSSVEEFIPLADEIATIENYLELQKVRYEGKFDYTIEVDEKIDKETISIPPMLAQPFIENSIEHGFKHKKSKGNMKIRVRLNNNLLRLEVEDDGVGREKAREILYKQNKDHKSLATAITHERIRVLNRKLKNKIKLQILDLKNAENEPSGTRVLIEIPCL